MKYILILLFSISLTLSAESLNKEEKRKIIKEIQVKLNEESSKLKLQEEFITGLEHEQENLNKDLKELEKKNMKEEIQLKNKEIEKNTNKLDKIKNKLEDSKKNIENYNLEIEKTKNS